jgi:hypothetical protein
LTFWGPIKNFIFLYQLGDWRHGECKIMDETTIKLGHAIENLYVPWGLLVVMN